MLFAVAADGWSCKGALEFEGVGIHFLGPHFEVQKLLIDFARIPVSKRPASVKKLYYTSVLDKYVSHFLWICSHIRFPTMLL